jgi:ABC-type antimicrobial peptide transport system permease subunit
MLIAIINFVIALFATVSIVLYINNYLRGEYGLLITILNFGMRQVILMLLISIGIAFISSFLPVNKIARKKPIDAIRNR